MIEVPVLIIGGGPVGLATAIELGWRGIECTLIEEGDGSVDHPRLGIVLTRTMEFCRRWGIADRVYNCGFQNDYPLNVVYCTSLDGYLLGKDENPSCNDMRPPHQSPERRQRCPQIWFNPLLEKAASEYRSISIHHFRRLEAFRELADCVEVDVVDTRTGERSRIRAKYVVACDGAASSVRRALNVQMKGNPALSYSVNLFVRSQELLKSHKMGPAERYIFVGKNGTWANMTVVDGRELWRFTIIGNEKMMDLETFDAGAAIARCVGRDDIPYELISVKPWRRTELTAEQFGFGRIFLAGDAAHTMSPTGGHGMSTGVADSVNLGWKLEAALNGWAGSHLLGSYDEERRPVAAGAAAASAKNFRAWVSASDTSRILEDTPEGAATRERVGQHMKINGREDWDSLGLQLGYCYTNSPICVEDGSPPPQESVLSYSQTSRPGARAPHSWLSENKSTLDLFGKNFVLLQFSGAPDDAELLAKAAADQSIPLSIVRIEDPETVRLYERKFVLVRPDGHVAWRGDAASERSSAIMAVVRGAASAQERLAIEAA